MEYLYLKWIDYDTNKKYVIGALYKKYDKYYFKLIDGYSNLVKQIKIPSNVIPFKDKRKIYESKSLFPIFKERLPNIENYTEIELKELLKKYNLSSYDEFEILKVTEGKLKLDNFIIEGEI